MFYKVAFLFLTFWKQSRHYENSLNIAYILFNFEPNNVRSNQHFCRDAFQRSEVFLDPANSQLLLDKLLSYP